MDDKGSTQKSYTYSGRKSAHASTAEDLLHNLDDVTGRVFRTFEETTPSKFRTFFKSSKYDKFLHALIYYFVTFFKLQNLQAKKDSLGDDQLIGKDAARIGRNPLDSPPFAPNWCGNAQVLPATERERESERARCCIGSCVRRRSTWAN